MTLLPIYHPAAALYTPSMVDTLRADFALLPQLLAAPLPPQPDPASFEPPEPEPEPALATAPPPDAPADAAVSAADAADSAAAEDLPAVHEQQLDLF